MGSRNQNRYLTFPFGNSSSTLTKAIFKKIFEGKFSSETLLQIFCKFTLHSKVTFESMTGSDDTCPVDLQAQMGKADFHVSVVKP